MTEIIGNSKYTEMFKMSNFKPNSYNIWSYGKQGDRDTTVFGTLPQDLIEQILYYYTKPFDIVYDPFGGAGITVDACKKWYRRYYVSDMNPTEIALTKNIKKRKIQDGLPRDLPVPKIVFLDPPYWQQAKGKYSKDKDDLGNVSLHFTKIFNSEKSCKREILSIIVKCSKIDKKQ